MNEHAHHGIQRLVRQLVGGTPMPPCSGLVPHLATCVTCRTALEELARESASFPSPPAQATISAETVDAQLAEFIEVDRRRGLRTAAISQPALWWHIVGCVECATTYDLVRAGSQPGPSTLGFSSIQRVILPRSLVSSISTVLGGTFRGDDERPQIIKEESYGQHELMISLLHRPSLGWVCLVEVQPPLRGRAVLQIGPWRFVAAFSQAGRAEILGLPDEVVSRVDGPDLVLQIEQELSPA